MLRRMLIGLMVLAGSFPAFPGGKEATAQAIDELLKSKELKHSLVGIYAVSIQSGEEIYARNADISMIPASNNKLFTTAAALGILGPNYTYTTTVERVGDIEEGILKGHLVIVGSGDPTISGRFHNGDTTKVLRDWVEAVKAEGIQRVEGFVVGDDDLWNDDDYAPAWDWSYMGEWYGAPSSALSFNDNCVDLYWTAGEGVGQAATYETDPDTRYLTIQNYVTTRKKGTGADRFYDRAMHSRVVKVEGGVDLGAKRQADYASVDNPTRYFATVFAEMLERAGIEVVEGPADIDDFEDKTVFKRLRRRIASYQSPPLSELIHVINKRSQNFYAEQVLRTVGQKAKGVGGYKAGCQAVKEFLRKNGIDTGSFNMEDGSGLGWANRTSPKTLVDLLKFMHGHKHGAIFKDSLPIGGDRIGTLRARFGETSAQRKVASKIRGKTGSIFSTRTLSGYMTTVSGDELAYSIMFNNDINGLTLTMIDRIATLLANEGQGWK